MASSEVGLPSAMRCSGTCRVILTTRGQLTWEEHTRPITQLVMLINVKVVLFTGLRGEPTENKKRAKRLVVRILAVKGLLLPDLANRGGSTLWTAACQAPLSVKQSRPKVTNILKISAGQEMAGRTQPLLPFSALHSPPCPALQICPGSGPSQLLLLWVRLQDLGPESLVPSTALLSRRCLSTRRASLFPQD